VGANQRLYELMVNFAAYTGLRRGELIALTAGQISQAERVVTVDGKVVEVCGHLFAEAPKNRKRRRTIYPRITPAGWPLAEMVAARIAEVAVERASGHNPLGLMFPTPAGSTGGPPTSTAASSRPLTWRPGGAVLIAGPGGPGTACGTCSAPQR
jgi:integrase